MLSITQLKQDVVAEWSADIPYGTDKYQFCIKDNKIYLALLDSDNMTQDAFIASEWKIYGSGEANIYTVDGELPENRTVDLKGFVLNLLNGVTRMKQAIVGGTTNQLNLNENSIAFASHRDIETDWKKASFVINKYDAVEKTEMINYLDNGDRGHFILYHSDKFLYLGRDSTAGLILKPFSLYDKTTMEVLDQLGNVIVHRPYTYSVKWVTRAVNMYTGHSNRERTAVFKYWLPLPAYQADFSDTENIKFTRVETSKNIDTQDVSAPKVSGEYQVKQFLVPITGVYRITISFTLLRYKLYVNDWLGIGISKDIDKLTYRFWDTYYEGDSKTNLQQAFFESHTVTRDITLTKGDAYHPLIQSLDNGFLQSFNLDVQFLYAT